MNALSFKLFTWLFLAALALANQNLDKNLDTQRVDCYPEAPYSFGQPIETQCRQRNCLFQSSTVANVPWCFFPQESFGYTMLNYTNIKNGHVIYLRRLTKYSSPFPDPIDNLRLDVEYLNSKTLHFKIYDSSQTRYEVPIELNDVRDSDSFTPELTFTFENRAADSVFTFKVVRKSTGLALFDTSIGSFVFSDQFLQIATILPAGSNLYGFGENNHASVSHDMNNRLWGMWARDEPNVAGENLNQYGVQPVYNVIEADGNAHGVAFVNSNAMEYAT
jgi:hypothetical protein